jgi:hypothetical protein
MCDVILKRLVAGCITTFKLAQWLYGQVRVLFAYLVFGIKFTILSGARAEFDIVSKFISKRDEFSHLATT